MNLLLEQPGRLAEGFIAIRAGHEAFSHPFDIFEKLSNASCNEVRTYDHALTMVSVRGETERRMPADEVRHFLR